MELPLFPVRRRVTAVRSGGIKNWSCMQGKGRWAPGDRRKAPYEILKETGDGARARLPRLLQLLHQPTVCVLWRGNSQSCQLRWVGSCEHVCGQVGVYVWQVIYIFKSRSECVCVCVCGPEWVASLGSRSSEIASAAAAFGQPASRKPSNTKKKHGWKSER